MGPQRNVLIAVAIVLLVAIGLTVWEADSIEFLEPPPARPEPAAGNLVTAPKSPANPSPAGRESVPSIGRASDDAEAAIASGRVRGQIDVAPGATFPARFELVVASESVPERIFSFSAADRLVTLDLPPGRSQLSARADGLASKPLTVVREPGTQVPPFRLVLEAGGRVGGQVLDSRGAPLAELPVSLMTNNDPGLRTVATDAEGRYSFNDVPVGAYRVIFGVPAGPIAPVVAVEVSRSEVRDVPPQTMPDLGEAEIRVLDRASQPVEGARVRGPGQLGGFVDGVSDRNGIVRARFLPAGSFYLTAALASGRDGQATLEVDVGRIGRAEIRIRD